MKCLCIFDYSGTLVNEKGPVYGATRHLHKDLGEPPPSYQVWEDVRAATLEDYASKQLKPASDYGFESEEAFLTFLRQRLRYWYPIVSRESPPIAQPHAIEAIQRMGDCVVGIISAHPREFILAELETLGFDRLFSFIEGGVTDKTEAIRRVRALYGRDTQFTVYVGDTGRDVFAANAAGCISISVSNGYQAADDIRKGGVTMIIKDLSLLPVVLKP